MEPKHCRVASTNRQFQQLIVAEHGPHVRYELVQFLFGFWSWHWPDPCIVDSCLPCVILSTACVLSTINTTTRPTGKVLANHLPDINSQRIRSRLEPQQPQILHESDQHSLCQHRFIAVASVNCRAEIP
jgi:hypothetical protein